ncbi:MAG: sulfatase [Blastopirellula sp.]|nr:MAG: sulfatase [Blastopirellula sp.]
MQIKHPKLRLFAVVCLSFLSSMATAADQPNVLFIAVDDLNDWVGCLNGHPQALTPNIDRLAKRGVLFTNAHCAAPACEPSRTSLFTGQMPHHTGVWSNKGARLSKLRPNATVLPMSFAESGYQTLGTGKLGPNKNGFKDFFSTEQRWSPLTREAVDYTKEELPSKGTSNPRHVVTLNGKSYTLPLNGMPSDRTPDDVKGESFDWGPFDVPDSEFGDTQITDWAIDKLKQKSDKPLFLAIGYYRPHQPLWAPKRFFDRFKNSPGQLPPIKKDDLQDLSAAAKDWALAPITSGTHATVVKYQQWEAAVEAYLACVTYVDYEIGRLLDALDNSAYADNTMIVLWSDHGWHLGEKEHWGKWTGWERSTKVPLVIVPSKNQADLLANAGSRCDQPVNLVDLYPTLIELCQVTAPPQQLDGQSLVSLLREPNQKINRPSVTMFDPGNVSLRTNRWRYIQYADGSDELYDIKNDPNEWENLSDSEEHAKIKARLMKKVEPYVEVSKAD